MKNRIGIKHIIVFVTLALFSNACIEPYISDIEEQAKILTIEGALIKGNEEQELIISRTTTLLYQEFFPVRDCQAKIIDEDGNEYYYTENQDGSYTARIDDELLVYDKEYKLNVMTPSGNIYESDFEVMNKSSAVDSVYYSVEEKIESYTGEDLQGVQFYVDIKAADTISRYFRWKMTETFEYTSTGPIETFFVDESFEPWLVKDIWKYYRCWMTEDVEGLYMTNTANLTVNEKKRIPLQYVSNRGSELKIKYSLLVEQYNLGERAYNYWQQKKIATESQGGLYTRQPSQPISNIQNIDDEEEMVLGYFWVASKTEQRIFVPRINSLPVIEEECVIRPLDMEIDQHGPFPMYARYDEASGVVLTGRAICFNCELKGGTIIKPDFWE